MKDLYELRLRALRDADNYVKNVMQDLPLPGELKTSTAFFSSTTEPTFQLRCKQAMEVADWLIWEIEMPHPQPNVVVEDESRMTISGHLTNVKMDGENVGSVFGFSLSGKENAQPEDESDNQNDGCIVCGSMFKSHDPDAHGKFHVDGSGAKICTDQYCAKQHSVDEEDCLFPDGGE